jgi:hypothetical protein
MRGHSRAPSAEVPSLPPLEVPTSLDDAKTPLAGTAPGVQVTEKEQPLR